MTVRGRATIARFAFALCALWFWGGARTAYADFNSFEGLMGELSEVDGVQADFREEKHIAMLAAPLVNEGTLHFLRRAGELRLARHTVRPAVSSVLITSNQLVMGTTEESRVLSLSEHPVVRSFVDCFLGVMGGDRAAVERSYHVEYVPPGDSGRWQVHLRPRDARVARMISEVRIEGEARQLQRLQVLEVNGDRSDVGFSDISVDYRFRPDEERRVFRLQPRARPDTATP